MNFTKYYFEKEMLKSDDAKGWQRFALLIEQNIISTYMFYFIDIEYSSIIYSSIEYSNFHQYSNILLTKKFNLPKDFEINYHKGWNLIYDSEYLLDLESTIPSLCYVKQGYPTLTIPSLLINFKKKLHPLIKDCPELLTKLLDYKINFDNLPETIEEYNQCKRNN